MNWKNQKSQINKLVAQTMFGLVTDVDGTISPIVDQPDEAVVHPDISKQLQALSNDLPLVGVISGRMVSDVKKRVGIERIVYIGNHGFERMVDGEVLLNDQLKRYRPSLVEAKAEIEAMLVPGMALEDKNATLSVHYRNVEDQGSINQVIYPTILRIANEHDLELFSGRKVFELRPPVNINKGTALQDLVRDFALTAALYIGDDTTDVAAFQSARKMRREGSCQAYGVGVLSSGTPEAVLHHCDWTAEGVEDVLELFSFIARSRRESFT